MFSCYIAEKSGNHGTKNLEPYRTTSFKLQVRTICANITSVLPFTIFVSWMSPYQIMASVRSGGLGFKV